MLNNVCAPDRITLCQGEAMKQLLLWPISFKAGKIDHASAVILITGNTLPCLIFYVEDGTLSFSVSFVPVVGNLSTNNNIMKLKTSFIMLRQNYLVRGNTGKTTTVASIVSETSGRAFRVGVQVANRLGTILFIPTIIANKRYAWLHVVSTKDALGAYVTSGFLTIVRPKKREQRTTAPLITPTIG